MDKKLIVSLIGPIAAGKGVAWGYFIEQGFVPIKFSALIDAALKKEGLTINRANEKDMANKLRAQQGKDYWALQVIDAIMRYKEDRFVVDGVRNVEELQTLRRVGSQFVAIDAPQAMRFERLKKRNDGRDPLDFEEFKRRDNKERFGDPKDPDFSMKIEDAMMQADYHVINDASIDVFKKRLDAILPLILRSQSH